LRSFWYDARARVFFDVLRVFVAVALRVLAICCVSPD
jgi:hypothetical protein